MKHAVARYAFVMAATIALVAWILTFALNGPGATSAITLSAGVAAIVQIAAFAITRSMISGSNGLLERLVVCLLTETRHDCCRTELRVPATPVK